MEAIDQNFEDEDYEFEDYSDSNSLESIKEKNIEKLNESFCDSLDIDLDNSFSSHLSKEIDVNNNFPKRKKLLINDFLLINEQKINDLKRVLKQKMMNEYYLRLIH